MKEVCEVSENSRLTLGKRHDFQKVLSDHGGSVVSACQEIRENKNERKLPNVNAMISTLMI